MVGKRLPQGPLTISTPGKPNSENFFVGTFVELIAFLGRAWNLTLKAHEQNPNKQPTCAAQFARPSWGPASEKLPPTPSSDPPPCYKYAGPGPPLAPHGMVPAPPCGGGGGAVGTTKLGFAWIGLDLLGFARVTWNLFGFCGFPRIC